VCKAHSEMQGMSLLMGSGGMPPENFWKIHVLRLNLVLSEVQNCYAKDRLWKSAVREISLAVHATIVSTPMNICQVTITWYILQSLWSYCCHTFMVKSNIVHFIIMDLRPILKPQLLESTLDLALDNKLFTKLMFWKCKPLWLVGPFTNARQWSRE